MYVYLSFLGLDFKVCVRGSDVSQDITTDHGVCTEGQVDYKLQILMELYSKQ
jgi:hypothetical protein